MTPERWDQGAIWNQTKLAPELKYFDITNGAQDILQAGSTGGTKDIFTFTPVLGTDFFNRIGRSCQIQSIRIHGYYWPTNITTIVEAPTLLCQALVLDHNPNGVAAPNMGDIWAGTNGSTSGTGTSFRAPNTRKRYKVLYYDQRLGPQCAFITQAGVGSGTALNTGTGVLNTTVAIDSTQKLTFDHYVDAKKSKIGATIFNNASAGTYSDIEENALMLWFWAGAGTGVTYNGSWTAVYTSRVSYTDY